MEKQTAASRHGAVVAAIVGAAAVLRLHHLGQESLWVDEAWTLTCTLGSLGDLVETVRQDVHPPLYYLMVRLWARLLGTGETLLRLPSVLMSTGVVALTYCLGRRLVGRWAAVVAAAALAVAPFQVQYAQEARSYAQLLLLTVLSMLCLVRLIDTGGRGWSMGWLGSAAALVWTHYVGLIVLLCHWAIVLAVLVRDRSGSRRSAVSPGRWILLQFVLAVLLLPALVLLLEQAWARPADFWVPPVSWRALLFLGGQLTGVLPPAGLIPADWPRVAVVTALALIGLTALGTSRAARFLLEPGGVPPAHPRAALVIASWLLVPIAVATVLSLLGLELFTQRNLLVVTPAFALAVAALARRVGQPTLRALLVSLLVAAPAANLVGYFATVRKEQWREAGAVARRLHRPSDRVIADAWFAEMPFEHYLGREVETVRFFDEGLGAASRVWVVRSHSRDRSRVIPRALVRRGLQPTMARAFFGVELGLYVRPGDGVEAQGGAAAPAEVRVIERSPTTPTPPLP
jgi:hypothetical protein